MLRSPQTRQAYEAITTIIEDTLKAKTKEYAKSRDSHLQDSPLIERVELSAEFKKAIQDKLKDHDTAQHGKENPNKIKRQSAEILGPKIAEAIFLSVKDQHTRQRTTANLTDQGKILYLTEIPTTRGKCLTIEKPLLFERLVEIDKIITQTTVEQSL